MAQVFELHEFSDFEGREPLTWIDEYEAEMPDNQCNCKVYIADTASTYDVVEMLKEVIDELEGRPKVGSKGVLSRIRSWIS